MKDIVSYIFYAAVFVIVFSLLVYGQLPPGISKYTSFIKKTFSGITQEIEQEATKPQMEACQEKAKGLIPKKLTMQQYVTWNDWKVRTKEWNDGTEIKYSMSFRNGANPGENVNYLYPLNLFDYGDPLSYSKEMIAEDGTILGENHFAIEPILKPMEETFREERNSWGEVVWKVRDYEIVEYDFVVCNWINK